MFLAFFKDFVYRDTYVYIYKLWKMFGVVKQAEWNKLILIDEKNTHA